MNKKILFICLMLVTNTTIYAQTTEWKDTCVTNYSTSGRFAYTYSDNWIKGLTFPVYHETCLENQPTVFSPTFALSSDSFYNFNLSFNTVTTAKEYWRNFNIMVFLVKRLSSGKYPYQGVTLPSEIINNPNKRIITSADGDTILQLIKIFSANLPDKDYSLSINIYPEMFHRDGNNYSIALSFFPNMDDLIKFDTTHSGRINITDFSINTIGDKNSGDGAVKSILSPQKTSLATGQAVSFLLENNSTKVWDTVVAYYKTKKMSLPVKEKFVAKINPFSSQAITFSTALNLPTVEEVLYDTIEVWLEANQRGDKNYSNDTLLHVFTVIPYFSYVAPCALNFENTEQNIFWNIYSKTDISSKWSIIDGECAYVNTNCVENDAYLVSPAIKFKPEQSYKITVRYKKQKTAVTTTEKMSVGLSSQPSFGTLSFPQVIKFSERPYINDTAYTDVSFFYGNSSAITSDYYLFINANSSPFSGGLFIKEVFVEEVSSFSAGQFIDFDPVNPSMSLEDNLGPIFIINDVIKGQALWQINPTPGGGSFNSKYYYMSESGVGQKPQTFASLAPIWLSSDSSYVLRYDRSPRVIVADALKRLVVSVGRIPLSGLNSYDEIISNGGIVYIDTIQNAGYSEKTISLTVPESGFYYVEFENISPGPASGATTNYVVLLDNIAIINNDNPPVLPRILFAKIPTSARLGGTNVTLSATVKNPTANAFFSTATKICYKVNNNAPVRQDCDLSAYEFTTIDFDTRVNFSTITSDTVHIKFWIYRTSPNTPAQDTIYEIVVPYEGESVPYIENFSQNSINSEVIFTTRSSGIPNWNFVQNAESAYTGDYYAQCNYSRYEAMKDYLVFPPINLVKDSTYLISFYAATSKYFSAGKHIDLLCSKTGNSYDDFLYNGETLSQNTVENSNYIIFKKYYKATATTMHFFALYDNSPLSDVHLKVDRFCVVDSATAFLPDISIDSISYNDSIRICDMTSRQDVNITFTNNSYYARDTFWFSIKTDMYDTAVLIIKELKEGDRTNVTFREVWDLSTAGRHFIKISSVGDTVEAWHNMAVASDLSLSSLSVDPPSTFQSERAVSANIKSNTDSSMQNVRVILTQDDVVVSEKIIDIVTPSETTFTFDDLLYLPYAGSYEISVFIASDIPCNSNTSDDTLRATVVKEDSLIVSILPSSRISFTVYPNPTDDELNISIKEPAHYIEIIDLVGKIVARKPVVGSSAVLSLGNLRNGVYFVKCYYINGSVQIVRVVKK
ncbi:MAG: T9SS type A sorting domain-containing protein [Bacteroidales bacterium]|jgi:hypothetical protein|nr:T9SS type A sorting domain-containing protein [Bacteroidales bacterium]